MASDGAEAAWLVGGGEMGERIRRLDWASTPLGRSAAWPQSLRSAVSILLPSKAQICLFWGRELIKLYNDAYIPVLGQKHPAVLGHPAREVWSEIWDVLGPLLDGVIATGEAFRATDHLFYLERHGFAEETYFDVSYDPVRDESGKVGGVFCIVSETTGRVLGERRLATLRDLGRAKEGRTAAEACGLAISALASNPRDLPFVSLYLLDAGATVARGCGSVGVRAGHPLGPREVALDDPRWSFDTVLRTARPLLLAPPLADSSAALPDGAAPDRLLIHPLLQPAGQRAGFMVAGTSRFLALEGDYRDFIDLVAAQIGTAVTQASSYEQERARAEALAELDRAKTVFFSNISHEFRTPLTLMLGPLEDLLERAPDELAPGHRETLAVSLRNGRRLQKLVNTLLDFSRIQAGRHQAVYEPTDLGAFTAELAGVFRSAIERGGLRFDVDSPAGLEPVYVDRGMWEKIVLNLLSNAFKFTFDGAISVQLVERGPSVELTVRDTGIGIAPADASRIFDRFHRVEMARARTHEGSGIGLALVQELVRLHSGDVRVESRPNEGSAFSVALPRGRAHLPADRIASRSAEAIASDVGGSFLEEALGWLPGADLPVDLPAAAPGVEPSAPSDGARRFRIVVADDNADMRQYVSRLLRSQWDVESVGDGAAALAALRARSADLLLADVMMPGLGGFALLRAVRADPATRGIPVILLSARAGEESRVEGLEAGADDYVIKPFSARELVARVESHLKLKALREEADAERRLLLEREQRARAAAEAASRAKDEFLAVLSHELRTPLNAVYGWARILRAGGVEGEAARRALDVIMRNANAQVQLIDDMLDVSRIVSGKMRLDVRPVDLPAVVEAALDAARPAADAKGLHLQSVLDPRAVGVTGDPDRLQQVAWNLLSNAVKFTPRGGRVQVQLQRVSSHLELTVSDTGQGIAADVLPHVFERFQQADSTSTRRHAGLGLGLALVRHLVELHGGTVQASSAGEGQGATFTVRLPVAIAHASEPAEPRPAGTRVHPTAAGATVSPRGPSLLGLRVLVVDDDRDGLELVATILRTGGAEVQTGASAAEGFRVIQAWRPDVLISDIEMPEEDGHTFIRRVRACGDPGIARIPAVALTAYGRVEDRLRTLSAGYSMHVPKPVDPAELTIVVANLAGRL